jgi:hypothetical protein
MKNKMFRNNRSVRLQILWLFLASAISIAYLGCDKLLPAKFKAQNYNPAVVDERAGALMTSDTINDAQGNTSYYQYIPGPPVVTRHPANWIMVQARTLGSFAGPTDTTDNQIIMSKFNVLADSLPSLLSDTLTLVRYPGDTASAANNTVNVCYALLKAVQAEDIYIYLSLDYYYDGTVSNLTDYISIDLLREDTSLVARSTALPSASTYASTLTILTTSGAPKVVPVLAARYAFHLEAGTYIVRFTLSNPVEISNPQKLPPKNTGYLAISNQFKVVILPQ